ncbi:MAG: zinc-finger-containing protein [Clostridia bacterium]
MRKNRDIKCPYCGSKAVLRDAEYVYGEKKQSPGDKLLVCSKYPNCNSYVGVHKASGLPKGTLANGDLRNKRIETHKIFDKIWKFKIMDRRAAYYWLQSKLSLNANQAHIGNFSEYMCDIVSKESKKLLENNGYKINEFGVNGYVNK